MLGFEEREKPYTVVHGEKTSPNRVENQQHTQPTCDAGSGNRTKDTLVGGEYSHQRTNPVPQNGVKVNLSMLSLVIIY